MDHQDIRLPKHVQRSIGRAALVKLEMLNVLLPPVVPHVDKIMAGQTANRARQVRAFATNTTLRLDFQMTPHAGLPIVIADTRNLKCAWDQAVAHRIGKRPNIH